MNYYEPPPLEVKLTLGLGLTLLRPYYRSFARKLNLQGHEQVLDFGSGSGVCSRHIAARLDKGGQLHCVDVSRIWQIVIRRRLWRYDHVVYHCGSIGKLDLPDHSFDVILSHFVLHEIPNSQRNAIFRALAAKLKPGGRLIFREPEEGGFTPEAASALAQESGLHVKQVKYRRLLMTRVIDGCLVSNHH
jgi:SAM-dependent methyltransferase